MESRVKLAGHPVHRMLIPFPLGLLGMAVLFDLIALIGDRSRLAHAADDMIIAGVLAGLLAAVVGAIDWLALPAGTRAKRLATLHGVGNVAIVALFLAAWLIRRGDAPADAAGLPIVLEVVGLLAALVTGWLGGELVDRLGVGVDPDAHLDAPSSLSSRPARSNRP